MTRSFAGLRVLSFESRRAAEIAELIRRQGGEPISAPSMREVPISENAEAIEFARRLVAAEIDVAIFLTGVGTRFLAETLGEKLPKERLGTELAKIVTVARGPKPRAALSELGVVPTVSVPEPNTWRELLAAIDAATPLADRRVAVQEYGSTNAELIEGLEGRGARVFRVPVYRWALPDDLGPLRRAIDAVTAGEIDVAMFTSATQVEHLFELAGEERAAALRDGFAKTVVASIGPICAEALARHGIAPDVTPEHPKMGHLVRTAAEEASRILERKRHS